LGLLARGLRIAGLLPAPFLLPGIGLLGLLRRLRKLSRLCRVGCLRLRRGVCRLLLLRGRGGARFGAA
jgi:hypothetical protein